MVRWLAVILIVGSTFPALADKPRRGLSTYAEDESQVRDISKRPSKVKTFVETEEQPPEEFEFPWKHLAGVLLCFAVAAPFAFRLYRNVNDEIAASKEGLARPRRRLSTERADQA
jgi:hypothetical protein